MVTPLRFRAVTSSPNGKCRSIFLTGGVVSSFLRISLSSTVEGDVLIFLQRLLGNRAGASAGQQTYHPVPCVSLAINSSVPLASAHGRVNDCAAYCGLQAMRAASRRPLTQIVDVHDSIGGGRARTAMLSLLDLFWRDVDALDGGVDLGEWLGHDGLCASEASLIRRSTSLCGEGGFE